MAEEHQAERADRILAYVAEHEAEGVVLTVGTLAEATGIDPQHIVVEVERLIEGGYIAGTLQKLATGGDRRPWFLTHPRLTERGVLRAGRHPLGPPPAVQQRVLQVIYDSFRQVGSWPSAEYVDRVLDHEGIDLVQVLPDIPESLLVHPQVAGGGVPRGTLIVTLQGLTLCADAEADLEQFLCALKLCVDRERTVPALAPNEPAAVMVTAADVLAECQQGDRSWEPGASTRVLRLLQTLPSIWSGSTGPTAEGWSLTLARGIRAYRGVETLEDVLRVQEQQAAPLTTPPAIVRRERARLLPTGLRVGGAAAPPAPPQAPPSAFILMPFREPWSDDTHACIEAACASLKAEWPELQWRRADQIAEPGRITDQIMEAVRASTVVVADITGSNPNVMFEVGFARALAKPLVLLNQDPDSSPFDLHDFRQIAYATATAAKTKADLMRMLRNVLRAAATRAGQ
ncbi:MAG: hypothetical protein M0027_14095 [Candidatus Dormibacteraeota bacterium]|jgi:hypothetical protein|nr:hypothetical protein [Candidatus Dormibacteraeota bacterium]